MEYTHFTAWLNTFASEPAAPGVVELGPNHVQPAKGAHKVSLHLANTPAVAVQEDGSVRKLLHGFGRDGWIGRKPL